MLVGYMRISKADGSQVLDLQKDALLEAGVDPQHLYDDRASGMRACLAIKSPGIVFGR
jgi:hypothetical protein